MTVETFYDRSLRLWTALLLDECGRQIGSAGYGVTREIAVADLEWLPSNHVDRKETP